MWKKLYANFEEILVCALFLLIFVLLVGGVILRYGFSISFSWNIELCRYAFVWLTFVGAAYVRRDDGHIKIDLFANYIKKKLPVSGVAFYWIVTRLVTVVYLGVMVYFSFLLSMQTWRFKSQAMQMPQTFLYISVTLGLLMYLVREIIDTVRKLKSKVF
jgi:TRAP-type C4-dicarboxylate transport system permease small subunit